MDKKIAIVDGDVLCYLSFEPRWNFICDEQGNFIKEWNPETEKIEKKTKSYTKEEDAQYLRETWERFKKKLNELIDKLYCTDFIMAVQGDGNFRVDLFDLYKQTLTRTSSKPSEMSKYVPVLRQLAVAEDLAIPSDGREADDYIRIWAAESQKAGIDFVIASNDKDLLCIPGIHYNIKTDIVLEISEDQALRIYYEQLLQGDQTDNIPGIPGIGPVKAAKLLKDCITINDFQEKVVETYIKSFGTNWKQHLLANGKLIHIQRHENDWFDLKDWKVIQDMEYVSL
jgi:5'-3' exonuclease